MFLHKIRLENILSFKDAELDLRPLNVLIGANASGKSNLIRVFGLVRSLPKDLQLAISEGGGPRAWINRRTRGPARISLEVLEGIGPAFRFAFQEAGESYEITEEDAPLIFRRTSSDFRSEDASFPMGDGLFAPRQQSVLTQWRIPGKLIGKLASQLENIRLYREFKTGPGTQTRQGISASASQEFLSEDGANLAPVLSKMLLHGYSKELNRHLKGFFEAFSDVRVDSPGGVSQVYVSEAGVSLPFSAISLSDGTLRLLCLLAILLDPAPPPLVCLDEPEAGLHPDAIRMIADLLVEASSKTQLIVTTHSPALIDALSDQPESVVVCERDLGGFTQFKRLQSSDLNEWLEDYSLGELWKKGELGGQSLVNEIRLYFEGDPVLAPGFKNFFGEIKTQAEKKGIGFRVIGTGGKPESDFRKGRDRNPEAFNILLRDSEGPAHPVVRDDSVFWMVQLMEAWFLADPDALAEYYGVGFKRASLKRNPKVEDIPKADVMSSLKAATKETKKLRYHKTGHAPKLLELLDPKKVRNAAPNCERLFKEVLAKLA